jgi:hypothetical protein
VLTQSDFEALESLLQNIKIIVLSDEVYGISLLKKHISAHTRWGIGRLRDGHGFEYAKSKSRSLSGERSKLFWRQDRQFYQQCRL